MPKLVTKATSSVLNKFEWKISWQGAARTGKGFTLYISDEDMDDITKTLESLEKPDLLIDCATETVKLEEMKEKNKKQEGSFLWATMAPTAAWLIACMASSLIQPVSSSLINAISDS